MVRSHHRPPLSRGPVRKPYGDGRRAFCPAPTYNLRPASRADALHMRIHAVFLFLVITLAGPLALADRRFARRAAERCSVSLRLPPIRQLLRRWPDEPRRMRRFSRMAPVPTVITGRGSTASAIRAGRRLRRFRETDAVLLATAPRAITASVIRRPRRTRRSHESVFALTATTGRGNTASAI